MKIDIKYKMPLVGEYNKGISYCMECDYNAWDDDNDSVFYHIVGVADSSIGLVVIVECPKCFEKWYFHARLGKTASPYEHFIDVVMDGDNLHWNKKGRIHK